MLSRVAFNRTVGAAFLGAAVLSFGSAAAATVLVPVDGLSHADSYDTFLAFEDATKPSTPALVIVSKKLEFDTDDLTNRPNFGIQYDFSGNQNFASLTAALRYRQDPTEIKNITAEAETKLGLTTGTLRLASLNLFSTSVSFFYRAVDN